MNNDVLLVPINIEQPNVEAQSDFVVYVPQAHKDKPGIVKEGDGINIENGVVSLNKQTVEDMIDANKWVSYGFEQNLTEDEKGMARHNIGAGDNDFTGSWFDLANRPQETVDFAEEERQKSKNLLMFYPYNGNYRKTSFYFVGNCIQFRQHYNGHDLGFVYNEIDGSLTLSRPVYDALTSVKFIGLKPNATFTLSYKLITAPTNSVVLFGKRITSTSTVNTTYFRQITTDGNGEALLDTADTGIWISTSGDSVKVANIQLEEGSVATDYQPYNGRIVHQNDSPVIFAESERQKSKNLFKVNNHAGHSITKNGVTATINDDYTITFNGTSTASSWFDLFKGLQYSADWEINKSIKLDNTKYYTLALCVLSGTATPAETGYYFSCSIRNSSGTGVLNGQEMYVSIYSKLESSFKTVTGISELNNGYLAVNKGAVYNNLKLGIMICEGSDTEFQSWNGAIVHKKDIADVEHIETIYDMSSNVASQNWGYRTGLMGDVTVDNLDLSKYKRLKIYTIFAGSSIGIGEMDLKKSVYYKEQKYSLSMYVGPEGNTMDFYFVRVDVKLNKTSLTVPRIGYYTPNGTWNARHEDPSYHVYKIEGVY